MTGDLIDVRIRRAFDDKPLQLLNMGTSPVPVKVRSKVSAVNEPSFALIDSNLFMLLYM